MIISNNISTTTSSVAIPIPIVEGLSIGETSGVYTMSFSFTGSEQNLPPTIDDVVITGNPVEGEVLTATPTITLHGPYTLDITAYQWYRMTSRTSTPEAILGAVGNTYTLTSNDVLKFILVEVTVAQLEGSNKTSSTFISIPTSAVALADDGITRIDIGFRRSGGTAPTAKSPATAINDITDVSSTIADAVDIEGNATGVGIVLDDTSGFGVSNGVLSGNSTIFSDTTGNTNLYAINPTNNTITFSGLNNALTYNIEVLGHMSTGSTNFNRLTRVLADGQQVDFDAYLNETTVRLEGLTTDGAGNLVVTIDPVGTAGSNNFGVYSAMRLEIVN